MQTNEIAYHDVSNNIVPVVQTSNAVEKVRKQLENSSLLQGFSHCKALLQVQLQKALVLSLRVARALVLMIVSSACPLLSTSQVSRASSVKLRSLSLLFSA